MHRAQVTHAHALPVHGLYALMDSPKALVVGLEPEPASPVAKVRGDAEEVGRVRKVWSEQPPVGALLVTPNGPHHDGHHGEVLAPHHLEHVGHVHLKAVLLLVLRQVQGGELTLHKGSVVSSYGGADGWVGLLGGGGEEEGV